MRVTAADGQARWRDLIDGLGPSMFVGLMTPRGILIECNRPALVAAGLKPEDVLGKPFADTFWWSYSPPVQQRLREAIARAARGEASRYDARVRVAEDQIIDIDFSLQPLRDETGEVEFIVPSASITTEGKRAEAALQHSQTLLRMAGRLSRMGAWSVDLPDLELTWSDEVCTIHEVPAGFAPSVEEGINYYAPEFRETITRAFDACVRDGTPFDVELQIITAKGRRIWVRSMGEAERDAAGLIRRVQGAIQDISEQKRAGEALQASTEDFRALAEAMPQIVWMTGPDGSNIYCNQQWADYTGLTIEEARGEGWNKTFHPDDQGPAWKAWQHAQATMGTYSVECRLRRADGVYRWWLIRGVPMRDDTGSVFKWCGTCTDIHDLKQAEREISASEQRFAAIFQSGVIAIAIAEIASGRFVDVNDRAAEFFGYTRDEMIGRTVFDLGLWADPADRERLLASISGGPSRTSEEAAFRRKSGEIRHALVSMEAMTLVGMAERLNIVVLVDMTQHKQLESELRQAQKMDAVGRLAGGVAHDFNNSLGVILGYTELLMRKVDEAQRGKLEQILKATQRASRLTRQLLAFSRKQVVDPKVLDLNALSADLEQMLGRLIGEDIDLAIVPGAGLGQVKVDPGQLEQVVMNLCVNARDAMPDGGLLRIETANVELDAGHLAGEEPMAAGRYVMLAVSDTGGGMDAQILSKIFEPFFTTKEEGKGTGLGLAMVYGIVKQAGGYVGVFSKVGQGTTFKIYLPRIDAPETVPEPEASMPPRGWETILLVEDERALGAIAREILEEHGYRVIEAGGADEAIEVAGRFGEPIHLLLTDVVMPRMNGRVLAESLVAVRPELRVLYMSGYTDDIIAHRGVLESGTQLLEKPFTARALLLRVRDALERRVAGEPR